MNNQFAAFIQSELNELETRDVDQLFICIQDGLQEMGFVFTEASESELYEAIEKALGEKS